MIPRMTEMPWGSQSGMRPLAWYQAWMWQSSYTQAHGFSTHTLAVWPGCLVVEPTAAGRRFAAAMPLLYEYPAVVVERLSWLPGIAFPDLTGVLVDIEGRLGKVVVRGGSRGRLTASLRAAQFGVLEISRVGWEAPHAVTASHLGDLVDRVPRGVLNQF